MRLTKRTFPCKIDKYDNNEKVKVYKNLERHVFMKKKKLIAISAMLGVMLGTTLAGGMTVSANTTDQPTYALSSVFTTQKAELGLEKIAEKNVTKVLFSNEGSVSLSHNLAYEWREADTTATKGYQAKYFHFTFAFNLLNFKSVTVAMDSESAWATKEEKTTNKLTFTKDGETYYVQVNDDEANKKAIALEAKQELTLSFARETDSQFGEFAVMLKNGETDMGKLGVFENIAGKYGEYVYDEQAPLKITVDMGADSTEKAEVLIYNINGQKFNEVTDDKKVYDTAAPVLVVNEEFSSFTLGTAFTLDYTMVDVLQDTNISKTTEYYQYNPADAVVAEDKDEFKEYKKTLTTSTIIFPMPYTVGEDTTTMFKAHGAEYVSIRFALGDKTFKDGEGANAKAVYDLAWYTDSAKQIASVDPALRASKLWYVAFDRSASGATYKYVTADTSTQTNKIVNATDFDNKKKDFNDALVENAKEVYAGSNSTMYIPSMEWLFDDDNGYRNLKYTISYRMPASSSNSLKSDVAYNKLQLSTTKDGTYEFKVFAKDVEGNAMQYYLDGELVEVTADNVWAIEEIPYFSFSVKKQGLKVDDAKNTKRKDTSALDKSYTLSSFTVTGATSLKSDYALYKLDTSAYNATVEPNKQLSVSDFTSITFEQLAKQLEKENYTLNTVENGDYFALYLKAYATLVAEAKNGDAEAIKNCFTEIGILGDNLNNDSDQWEKFKWQPSSRSFQTVEQGNFLILADYWEESTPKNVRATAYKMVVVETKTMTYTGETDWLKNNVVSIVLFSIAGVLLVIIVILLIIKPSDEALPEMDEKNDPLKTTGEEKPKKEKVKKTKKVKAPEEVKTEEKVEEKTEEPVQDAEQLEQPEQTE